MPDHLTALLPTNPPKHLNAFVADHYPTKTSERPHCWPPNQQGTWTISSTTRNSHRHLTKLSTMPKHRTTWPKYPTSINNSTATLELCYLKQLAATLHISREEDITSSVWLYIYGEEQAKLHMRSIIYGALLRWSSTGRRSTLTGISYFTEPLELPFWFSLTPLRALRVDIVFFSRFFSLLEYHVCECTQHGHMEHQMCRRHSCRSHHCRTAVQAPPCRIKNRPKRYTL